MNFYGGLWKIKKYPVRGLKKGSARKQYPPFSRGGPKRGNPTMTSTITARRKGYPQHYVEGLNKLKIKALTNATRRNHFSTKFQLFCQTSKVIKKPVVSISFSPGGRKLWHWQNHPQTQQITTTFRTRIVHTSWTLKDISKNISSKYLHIYRKRHRIRYTH